MTSSPLQSGQSGRGAQATSVSRVLVVLPAYNEAAELGRLLPGIDATLRGDGLDYLIVLVDDGSSDNSLEVAQALADVVRLRTVRHERNQGLGGAIRDGLRAALESAGPDDAIVVMDADNTHAPGFIRGMLDCLADGADVVIASRYQSGSVVRGVPPSRRALSAGASLLLRTTFPTPGVKDYTCGYRAYRAAMLRRAFERYGDEFVSEDGFACMVDILLKLRQMGARFRETPFLLDYGQKSGPTKMKVLRTIRRTLALVVRRRLESIRGPQP